jgi:uncharacterized protein
MIFRTCVVLCLFAWATLIAYADTKRGLAALEGNKIGEAAEAFNAAFEKGDGDGAFYLGRMVELGVGVEPDIRRAAQLYDAGAVKGSALAKSRLGLMKMGGEGVLQDFDAGAKLVCDAAEAGLADAQFNCGNLYLSGKGVTKDMRIAMQWMSKASAKSHVAATNFLALGYMAGEGVPTEPDKARELFATTAAQGNALGLFYTALFFEEPGRDADPVKAHAYFNLAAARGHPGAAEKRDLVASKLSDKQISEAQNMAQSWTASSAD